MGVTLLAWRVNPTLHKKHVMGLVEEIIARFLNNLR